MKFIKILLSILLLLGAILFITIKVINEPLPVGETSTEADQMALKMMQSLNVDAWKNTDSVAWTFKGIHHYKWYIPNHKVTIQWDDILVKLDHNDASGVLVQPENQTNDKVQELIKKSWDYFNNDSFWLIAPFKAFDKGTERSIVTLEDGRKGLKVTYASGGTTPGDSYVWVLGKDNRPTAIKMWVSIIPVGGIEFTWENYTQLHSGAWIAQDHWLSDKINISLTDVR